MKIINSNEAPKAVGPYSQGVIVQNTLYVSGQLPFNPEQMVLISKDIKDQTHQCLKNVLSIVKSAGFELEDIVKCTVYMTDLNQFELMNETYATFFKNHKPARVTIEVSKLPKNVSIEIDAIAHKEI
ncbi:MAG: RidA family protein [Acholeplasmataceae bacterium]